MAPTHADGGSGPDRPTGGEGPQDGPDQWGNNGKVGEGRYRLTRRLGRGGMAEVFAAEDVRLGRTVAVKLLRADLAADTVAKARFTREAQSVAGLNHHAVVAVYDSGEDQLDNGQTVPFIVMELVEGRTIRELLLNAEAPPLEQALAIVSGVLAALSYSHQRGIVHRDIKPANVIITNEGAVKVMDFGIARALHAAGSTMTQTGMVMGTPQYLSPEQALGRAVDARSDLYATGCMLYELLALRPPFVGETPLSVVYQHVQDPPAAPSEISERVPPELDGLVLRALAKEPDDRYQSAEEMSGEIQYALRMLSSEGGHTGTWATGHSGPTTPPMGTPLATTMAVVPPEDGPLGPPLLIGPPDGGDHQPRRRGRRVVLVAVVAVLAISVGVFAAIKGSLDDEPSGSPKRTTSEAPQNPGKKPKASPEQESTPDDPTGGDEGGDTWTEPETYDPTTDSTPSWDHTSTETSEPTGGETSTQTTTPPPDGSDPPTDPTGDPTPTDTGTDDTSAGTVEGTDVGGTDAGTGETTGQQG
ncbi:serine/threonine protein kinase [Wenjunlia vitaminophila]|uniref:non-specific serine/threonine protein kinase n=1 Tax=Wenjunlia vitaminophila TaxID=76728 RepID=A0A0T6LNG9_WENVI|nr:protein kinase [Wenjunlia vitaminophila]KRV47404.1 serine/threonine protein kinase [Wenjunlia vitaminophila]